MKVISIKEPWASLIKEDVKRIETRSWKTNYRGEIYIHASKKKLTKNELVEYDYYFGLLKNVNFDYGCIIAKANLVDCVFMDEHFMSKISGVESKVGEFKEGRYAWILENIEPINPIVAKGQLGIWNYDE